MTTSQENNMHTIYDLIGNDPNFCPGIRAWLREHGEDADPSLRAGAESSALGAVQGDVLEEGECAHGVLTTGDDPAMTCDNAGAPVSQTDDQDVPDDRRTSGAPRYSTDPNQSLRDLKRRTRRDLAGEVRRLRRECAKVRRNLRDAEERISELGGGDRG